ncbi:sigma-54-dependent Fis family transcriptional regulator [bacterium]|nr:sigma-54-dependent Fis family transcriptional regulator [bacterium]
MTPEQLQRIKSNYGILGSSMALDGAIGAAARVAETDITVLIHGENGSGKESFSKIIHSLSRRKHKSFFAINCGGIPSGTINSELFGHEKGSFTGAHERKIGKFELANGGTLFLDEVGDMGHKMQAKILRALEECVIQRVGGQDSIELDLRVVCATNKDLKKEIKLGNFREDLFYRLNVIPLTVPSLRERREDIPLLVRYFLESFSGNRKIDISSTALEALQTYPWPGNVRELKNWIERACILSSGNDLQWTGLDRDEAAPESPDLASPQEKSLREARANFEKQFILKVLAENGGNVSKTAQHIGVERSHLHKKIKAYGIDISDQGGTG